MARIDPIPMDQMTPDQRRLNDEIAGSRGGGPAKGPFALWLRTPELAEHANAFGSYLRHGTTVPQRLVELAVLVVARTYTAQYEWYVHVRRAIEVGLDEAIIDEIRHRRRPDFKDPKEALVYDMTLEIVEQRQLGDTLYASAKETFGEPALVELIALIGFYVMIAVFLNSFQVEVPDPAAVLLSD